MFGEHVACIVCCEVVQDPKYVRFSNTNNTAIDDQHKLPKGYIVVEDNNYVRVKYLLVYKNFLGNTKKKLNICQIIFVLYILFLFGMWLLRSGTVRQYLSRNIL
eukprot:TRINITY_DN7482_c0_g1_i1.p1 TRINITY_DN7482_c0_g1~~TRINITY_DN7482_c0_g1_i1.p1  ORF type:complete len:104 (-),score=22.61 TRINITY_DN7482_c0_g1_i1:19-330(-)